MQISLLFECMWCPYFDACRLVQYGGFVCAAPGALKVHLHMHVLLRRAFWLSLALLGSSMFFFSGCCCSFRDEWIVFLSLLFHLYS